MNFIKKLKKHVDQTKKQNSETCPLCGCDFYYKLHEDNSRQYYRCTECSLIFVPSKYHLSHEQEKKRYDLHNNNEKDMNHRAFLSKLLVPFLPKLHVGAKGLDYGSGPAPVLNSMLSDLGFKMNKYDPIYTKDETPLSSSYDFITCTETAEHFNHPKTEWEKMLSMVRKGGLIGVMTQMLDDEANFSDWHYKRDNTHVCFYSKKTFLWLAQKYNLDVNFAGNSFAIFRTRA